MHDNTPFTLYAANCRDNPSNSSYPNPIVVRCEEDMTRAASHDHVAAEYKAGKDKRGNTVPFHRSIADFMRSDCYPFDVDNGDTENPADWIIPEHVQRAFPGVAFYVVYSRNHMKPKNGKTPRPRFHVYFPDTETSNKDAYKRQKDAVCAYFPAFDRSAKDAARFFFGVINPVAEYYPGAVLLSAFMASFKGGSGDSIPEGQRNSTLSHFAGRILKKYGDADGQARKAFDEEAAKCTPPLESGELSTIWGSALSFFRQTVQAGPDYIPPAEFTAANTLIPLDFSDVGEAAVLAREYAHKLRYCEATGFLKYDGKVWEASDTKARGLQQQLTDRQLEEANAWFFNAHHALATAKASDNKGATETADADLREAERYRKFVLKSRDSGKITSALREAQPKIEIAADELDADPFKLNTPGGTVDMKTGEMLPHDPEDFCTKMTAIAPDDKGMDLWLDAIDKFTSGDSVLAEYCQRIAGMCIIGKVLHENLVIAYGTGRNGKSTFFNVQARVLGDYSGNLSAETLTTGCRKNKSPEYAELRGKRLVIAAELEEGQRLDTSVVKNLCSTDEILAEPKYKQPFSFTPSHTTILYTNHLPKVGTTDKGTWRRLIVVPFTAIIEGNADIKNYADHLIENAGGAILAWMIEGARKFIAAKYEISLPECVARAIEQYHAENDWLNNYLTERCTVEKRRTEKSGKLYADYRQYCADMGDYTRSAADFKAAIEGAGFETKKTKAGGIVHGLYLSEYL